MGDPMIAVGLQIGTQPPLGTVRAFALFARLARLESVMAGPPPELEEAIAAVPPGLVEEGPLMWGTPEQLASQLRGFGEVGLRHVVLAPVSGLVSRGLRSTGYERRAKSPG